MNRRLFWFVAALVCAVAAIFAVKITDHHEERTRSVPVPAASRSAEAVFHSAEATREATSRPAAPAPAQSIAENVTVEVPTAPARDFTTGTAKQKQRGATNPQLLAVKGMLRDYRAAIGQNPVGNNSEITKALLGANPRRAQFISPVAKLNNERELVDGRNHPFFFHQISGAQMEVRSAGPDGVMWTSDDEVSR